MRTSQIDSSGAAVSVICPTPSGDVDRVVILDTGDRLRDEFGVYGHHRSKISGSVGYPPDVSALRPISEVSAMVGDIQLKGFRDRLRRVPVQYESCSSYLVGFTRAHILTRYVPKLPGSIGVREYCGLPCFPDRVLKVSLFLSELQAYAHQASPSHSLFSEPDKGKRSRFLNWYARAAALADTMFGTGSLLEFRDFRRTFLDWAKINLRPTQVPS